MSISRSCATLRYSSIAHRPWSSHATRGRRRQGTGMPAGRRVLVAEQVWLRRVSGARFPTNYPGALEPSTKGSRTPRSGRSRPSGAWSASISASGDEALLGAHRHRDHRDERDGDRDDRGLREECAGDPGGLRQREPRDDARRCDDATRDHADRGSRRRQARPPDPQQEKRTEGAGGQRERPPHEQGRCRSPVRRRRR